MVECIVVEHTSIVLKSDHQYIHTASQVIVRAPQLPCTSCHRWLIILCSWKSFLAHLINILSTARLKLWKGILILKYWEMPEQVSVTSLSKLMADRCLFSSIRTYSSEQNTIYLISLIALILHLSLTQYWLKFPRFLNHCLRVERPTTSTEEKKMIY